jgi:hypothetical protein
MAIRPRLSHRKLCEVAFLALTERLMQPRDGRLAGAKLTRSRKCRLSVADPFRTSVEGRARRLRGPAPRPHPLRGRRIAAKRY